MPRYQRPHNLQSLALWALRPLFRRKLRQLERFSGPESYAHQMKKLRLIATLEACLMY
jgi:hypothetical protein